MTRSVRIRSASEVITICTFDAVVCVLPNFIRIAISRYSCIVSTTLCHDRVTRGALLFYQGLGLALPAYEQCRISIGRKPPKPGDKPQHGRLIIVSWLTFMATWIQCFSEQVAMQRKSIIYGHTCTDSHAKATRSSAAEICQTNAVW